MIARLAAVVRDATSSFEDYDYARALERTEPSFWWYCDYYVELVKGRRYDSDPQVSASVSQALRLSLSVFQRLLAPFLPYITEEIYQGLFRQWDGASSIHLARWPLEQPEWIDVEAEAMGETLLGLLRQVRRYKVERGQSVGAELASLRISGRLQPALRASLEMAMVDLKSATRAKQIVLEEGAEDGGSQMLKDNELLIEV